MFDAYQVQRVLRGHLADGDAMETLARDDATGGYWVLTHDELLVVQDQQIAERMPRVTLAGEVETTDVAVTIRLRGADRSRTMVGTFRKANRLTKALAAILDATAR